MILLGLLFMVIGLIAGIGKWRLGRHGLLFLLLFIQLWLAWIGFELPFPVGFLHPINALLITGAVRAGSSWDEWQLWRKARNAGAARGSRSDVGRRYSGALWCSAPTRNGVLTPA